MAASGDFSLVVTAARKKAATEPQYAGVVGLGATVDLCGAHDHGAIDMELVIQVDGKIGL